jgi:hypothetical protein
MPVIFKFTKKEGQPFQNYLNERKVEESVITSIVSSSIFSFQNSLDSYIYFKIDSEELESHLNKEERENQSSWMNNHWVWKPLSPPAADVQRESRVEERASESALQKEEKYENDKMFFSSITPKDKAAWYEAATKSNSEPVKKEFSIPLNHAKKSSQGSRIITELRRIGFLPEEISLSSATVKVNLEASQNLCHYRTLNSFDDSGRCEIFSFYVERKGEVKKGEDKYKKAFEIKVFKDKLEYTNLLNPNQERLKRRGWHFTSSAKELNSKFISKVRDEEAFRRALLQAVTKELELYRQTLETRKKGPLGIFEVRTTTSKRSVIDAIDGIKNGNELNLTQKMADIVYYGKEEKKALEKAFASLVQTHQVPFVSKSREMLEILQEVSRFAAIDYQKSSSVL